ncbi:MAG TPA: baseplate J/gp47 family protein, partial [Candidatus Omnitrophota bacterium]|nr:baseplate J/gp47 family protein [Candidatus Omnitrophota bacterium]
MFAQGDVNVDQFIGETLAAMMSPTGANIDLLNPNNPRNLAKAASGYVYVTNSDVNPVAIAINTLIRAASGQEYSVGVSSFIIPGSGSAYIYVTCTETGIGGNIPAGQTFQVVGYSSLSGVNSVPFLNGTPLESDAIYLNRVTSEKTEYGSQNGSVAVETELKKYFADARMYVNPSATAKTVPVPVPASGYNCVVLVPNGVLSSPEDIAQVFLTLSERLEFINSQSLGDARHVVLSGTTYTSQIPVSYFFTVAQPVETTLHAVINVRASSLADRTELISQANGFAKAFIDRLVKLFTGINGSMSVTYHDGVEADVVTAVAIAGSNSFANSIAPAFGIATINSLVCDIDTISDTPQILYDSVNTLSMIIDPGV